MGDGLLSGMNPKLGYQTRRVCRWAIQTTCTTCLGWRGSPLCGAPTPQKTVFYIYIYIYFKYFSRGAISHVLMFPFPLASFFSAWRWAIGRVASVFSCFFFFYWHPWKTHVCGDPSKDHGKHMFFFSPGSSSGPVAVLFGAIHRESRFRFSAPAASAAGRSSARHEAAHGPGWPRPEAGRPTRCFVFLSFFLARSFYLRFLWRLFLFFWGGAGEPQESTPPPREFLCFDAYESTSELSKTTLSTAFHSKLFFCIFLGER